MEELNRLPDNQDITLPSQQPVFTGAPISMATKKRGKLPFIAALVAVAALSAGSTYAVIKLTAAPRQAADRSGHYPCSSGIRSRSWRANDTN